MNTTGVADIYTDFAGLGRLRADAARDAQGSLDEVARQFESLLMGQMLRSMRQASLGEGVLDNDQSLFYRDMFDQQLSLHLAKSGGMGLAEAIKRQMGEPAAGHSAPVKGLEEYRDQVVTLARARSPGTTGKPTESGGIVAQQIMPEPNGACVPDVRTAADPVEDPADWGSEKFVHKLWPWALEAAERLGLKPQALLAQAALETGWGRHIMRQPDGSVSHNLFGIKADRRWDGDRVSVNTLEYEQGVAVKKRDYFRAYESFRDSFNDYVDFLRSNPRYQDALRATASSQRYFTALQQAGYATDPRYAEKIDSVLRGPEMSRALDRLKASGTQSL